MKRAVKFAVLVLAMVFFKEAIGQWDSEASYKKDYFEGLAGDSEYCGIYEFAAPDNSKYSIGIVQSESEFLCYNLDRRNSIWHAGRLKATLKKSSSDTFNLDWVMGDGENERRCLATWEDGGFEIIGLSAGKTRLTKKWPLQRSYSTPSDYESVSAMEEMSKSELRLARNSIYARHGRIFSSPDLIRYFKAKEWYESDSSFADSMLTQEEKDTVLVIQMWERSTSVLWKKRVDLDGDGALEHCTAMALDSQYCVIVNNQVHVFADLWSEEKAHAREFQDFWFEDVDVWPDFLVGNLDESNASKQLWITQRYAEREDPGMLNHFLFYHNDQLFATSIGSGDYNAGHVSRDSLGTWTLRVSNCPESFRRYSVGNTGLVLEEEINHPPPPGGCAACVHGDALVDMADGTKQPLKDLRPGDHVRAVDASTGNFDAAKVESLIKVSHEAAMQYRFEQASIIATEDHPFLSTHGVWVSLNPTKTNGNYVGYEDIEQFQVGDKVVDANGDEMKLLSVMEIPLTAPVYSIEGLSWGRGFVANGVVVGVAKPRQVVAGLSRDMD